jgi:hypothetical protein
VNGREPFDVAWDRIVKPEGAAPADLDARRRVGRGAVVIGLLRAHPRPCCVPRDASSVEARVRAPTADDAGVRRFAAASPLSELAAATDAPDEYRALSRAA